MVSGIRRSNLGFLEKLEYAIDNIWEWEGDCDSCCWVCDKDDVLVCGFMQRNGVEV